MLWRKPPVVEILVPVVSGDTRSYGEKWKDNEYLKAIENLHGNRVFISESMEALRCMRNTADEAATPEELAGVNKCLKIFKAYMVVPEMAKRRLKAALDQDKAEKEADNE